MIFKGNNLIFTKQKHSIRYFLLLLLIINHMPQEITIELILLIISFLFFISIVVSKTGYRFGVPVLLLFLVVGMLSGGDGLGIEFENIKIAQTVGTLALCIILFSGGLDTKLSEIKPIIAPGLILATIGVILTATITGLFVWWISGLTYASAGIGLTTAILLASTMSSTDSASVFAILRTKSVNLKQNIRPLLELESGSNDPMAYMLTITLIEVIKMGAEPDILIVGGMIAYQLIIGIMAGFFIGKLAVLVINHLKMDNDSLYPILVLTTAIFVYSFTYYLKGNGFMAVYISGLVIGNSRFVHKRFSLRFMDGLAWLSQILLFLTLGLLVNPRELIPLIIPGLLISFFIILIARPLAVYLCLLPFRKISFKSKAFISWVGLRGAVPIIFAILPLAAGIPHARFIFNIVFFSTLISLMVQGTTLTWIAKWLGQENQNANSARSTNEFELDFSDSIKSTQCELYVTDQALLKGNRLMDLSLPDKTLVVMVKRGDRFFIPRGDTALAPDDKLLVITDDLSSLSETFDKIGLVPLTR